jgi:hypothetical protein
MAQLYTRALRSCYNDQQVNAGTIAIYWGSYMKHTNTLSRQNVEVSGTYSNHWVLNG